MTEQLLEILWLCDGRLTLPAEDAELRLGEGDESAVVVDKVARPVHESRRATSSRSPDPGPTPKNPVHSASGGWSPQKEKRLLDPGICLTS